MTDAPPSHPPRLLWLRVLAAIAVALLAVAVEELVLDRETGSSDTHGAKVVEVEIKSVILGRAMPVNVVVPKGARDGKRSLLVFLHGRGADQDSYLDDEMFRALSRQGGRAPVVAFPFGGDSSYWHDRADGRWGSYVLHEVLPQLRHRFEIEADRIGIGGISMGGFGAYDLARLQPGTFCAVGGHSAALWQDAGDTPVGAFDDAGDFDRNDVIAIAGLDPSPYAGLRTWLDVGDEDPFAEADGALAAALQTTARRPIFKTWPGRHDDSYWSEHWGAYMRFYAGALHACGKRAEAGHGDLRASPGPDAGKDTPKAGHGDGAG